MLSYVIHHVESSVVDDEHMRQQCTRTHLRCLTTTIVCVECQLSRVLDGCLYDLSLHARLLFCRPRCAHPFGARTVSIHSLLFGRGIGLDSKRGYLERAGPDANIEISPPSTGRNASTTFESNNLSSQIPYINHPAKLARET